MVYICSILFHLAAESSDLPEAEVNIIIITSWANELFFSLKMARGEKKLSFWLKIVVILWIWTEQQSIFVSA